MTGPHDIEWDEELPQPPERPPARLRWSLAGAAVVLAAVALVAHGSRSNHPGASAPTSSAAPAPSFSDVVSASAVAPTAAPRPDSDVPTCPAGASCSVVDGVPDGLSAAFAQYFPHARVAQVVSTLAERPGRFGPDLLSRTVVVYDGKRTVTVSIRKPRATDESALEAVQSGGSTVSRVVEVTEAFTLSADVREPIDEESIYLNTLAAVLEDPRLVAPQ